MKRFPAVSPRWTRIRQVILEPDIRFSILDDFPSFFYGWKPDFASVSGDPWYVPKRGERARKAVPDRRVVNIQTVELVLIAPPSGDNVIKTRGNCRGV